MKNMAETRTANDVAEWLDDSDAMTEALLCTTDPYFAKYINTAVCYLRRFSTLQSCVLVSTGVALAEAGAIVVLLLK